MVPKLRHKIRRRGAFRWRALTLVCLRRVTIKSNPPWSAKVGLDDVIYSSARPKRTVCVLLPGAGPTAEAEKRRAYWDSAQAEAVVIATNEIINFN